MSETKYNGWANRETWLVNLWFSPVTQEDLLTAKDSLEEQREALDNGPLRDMICLSVIDWRELSEHMDDGEGDDGGE